MKFSVLKNIQKFCHEEKILEKSGNFVSPENWEHVSFLVKSTSKNLMSSSGTQKKNHVSYVGLLH